MNNQSTGSIWLALAVIILGVGSLVLLDIQPKSGAHAQTQQLPGILATTTTGNRPTKLTLNIKGTPLPTANPTPSATPTATPLPPLVLPAVPAPADGQVYLLTPVSTDAVGWAQADDEKANHFGDYNIYAGIFDGKQHVGAMQFDLSGIPPGSPLIYADLTLTGLSSEWLAGDGTWRAQMLAAWIDKDWNKRTFHWLARADSGSVLLDPPLTAGDLGATKANTFFLSPEALTQLEARLFTQKVSFRITGPAGEGNTLFSWDSGVGNHSLGRPPLLRIVTGGPAPAEPPPSPTPDYVILTPTPADGPTLVAIAAERLTLTAQATPLLSNGTPEPTATVTPLPPNWVTPVIVTNTPVPTNQATAIWQVQVATAAAVVRGTATQTPPNVWTATSTPLPPPATATPLIVAYDALTPTPTPTPTLGAIPALLRGKILFYSDRNGKNAPTLMVMDADGGNIAVWTGGAPDWIYAEAVKREDVSPDGGHRVIVSDEQIKNLQLWSIDLNTKARLQLTHFKDVAYDPVWSPVGNTIAFVSPEPGNDEIFLVNSDSTGVTRLTTNTWEWDKHPSWAPDGKQIVFWSNRETRRKQIWIMNADGSNQRNLSSNEYNDWDPVWVK